MVHWGSHSVQRKSCSCSLAWRLCRGLGISLKARAQQIARSEVKAQTIRLGSEASILLQRQTRNTRQCVTQQYVGCCLQQHPYSHCQEKLHGQHEKLWREEFERERQTRARMTIFWVGEQWRCDAAGIENKSWFLSERALPHNVIGSRRGEWCREGLKRTPRKLTVHARERKEKRKTK